MKNQLITLEVNIPTDVTIFYRYTRRLREMPESEQEHVIELLGQGYVEGELIYNNNHGWWWRED